MLDCRLLSAEHPLPPELKAQIVGTDIDNDGDALFAAAKQANPSLVVELGTRGGLSTRILSAATTATIVTVDIIDCTQYLADVPCIFIHKPAEELERLWRSRNIDLLFIDTDPHSEEQTLGWLNTWVEHKLRPTGCALFHDSLPPRGVDTAIEKWLQSHPDWRSQELGSRHGMRLLLPPESTFEIPNGS